MEDQVGVIRVFTDDVIRTLGNPAGVYVSDELLSAPEMSKIAVQAAQPITAFLSPVAASGTEYDIRYYDLGGRECHICGHATLAATAQLLRLHPELDGKDITCHLNPALFEGQSKALTTHIRGKKLSIDLFPSKLRYENAPALLGKIAEVLKIGVEAIDKVAFSVNIRDYVVALKSPEVLLEMRPDFAAMKAMAASGPFSHEGLMVSCLAPQAAQRDLYVRVFLPITGVNEDIACGSGNCSIIPLWHDMGLNQGTKHYTTVFPFPEGKAGFVGGVQDVVFAPDEDRITITAQAVFEKTLVLNKAFSNNGAAAVRGNAL